uniref:Uncharacterized protein n=1 Tax=Glossina pallidipes TaxID=7398 RepID=A0A1A9ZN02_GLOPL
MPKLSDSKLHEVLSRLLKKYPLLWANKRQPARHAYTELAEELSQEMNSPIFIWTLLIGLMRYIKLSITTVMHSQGVRFLQNLQKYGNRCYGESRFTIKDNPSHTYWIAQENRPHVIDGKGAMSNTLAKDTRYKSYNIFQKTLYLNKLQTNSNVLRSLEETTRPELEFCSYSVPYASSIISEEKSEGERVRNTDINSELKAGKCKICNEIAVTIYAHPNNTTIFHLIHNSLVHL